MIRENVTALLKELEGGNCYHERVTLVAATKTRTPAEINEAIAAGITDIGENKVQEFTAKFDEVNGARRHFIGHLQLNKVKYLIGRTDLIESVDRRHPPRSQHRLRGVEERLSPRRGVFRL